MSWWKKLFVRDEVQSVHVPQVREKKEQTIDVVSSDFVETFQNLTSLVANQEQLLAQLSPIPRDVAMKFFQGLGVSKPNEYNGALDAFSSFRSFALSSQGSEVHTWYLQIEPSSRGYEVLYIHIYDSVFPLGLAICKVTSGGLVGYYSNFKDKLNL